jgi:NAD(P)-dependent dehydrogenase (short-subunit alcohol dehydrogenase family)
LISVPIIGKHTNAGRGVASLDLDAEHQGDASKGAVAALTQAMPADFVGQGLRVKAVIAGTADTPWVQRLLAAADDPPAMEAALRARQPIGRLVSPQEVAHAIAYLAGPSAASTTGTLLAVDGGMTGVRVPLRP